MNVGPRIGSCEGSQRKDCSYMHNKTMSPRQQQKFTRATHFEIPNVTVEVHVSAKNLGSRSWPVSSSLTLLETLRSQAANDNHQSNDDDPTTLALAA